MKKIIIAASISGMLMCSCSKNEVRPHTSITTPMRSTVLQHKDGGDDDDPVIIIEKSVALIQGVYEPVSNAKVTLSQANNVIIGETDENGGCNMYLPYLGTWHLSIIHDKYSPVDVYIDVLDSTSNRIDTLQ